MKRSKLFKGIDPEAGETTSGVDAAAPPTLTPTLELTQAAAAERNTAYREGKRYVTVLVDPDMLKKLKRIALDEDKTLQDLGLAALNDVLRTRGMI